MTSTARRTLLVGCSFTSLGILLLAAGAWRGSDPLAKEFVHLLLSGALTVGGILSLVAGYRRMAVGLDGPGRPWPEDDRSLDG